MTTRLLTALALVLAMTIGSAATVAAQSGRVTFERAVANGTNLTTTSTQLNLTFSNNPGNLTADNISVTGGVNVTGISGTGNTRTVNISGYWNNNTAVAITVSNPPGVIIAQNKQVAILHKNLGQGGGNNSAVTIQNPGTNPSPRPTPAPRPNPVQGPSTNANPGASISSAEAGVALRFSTVDTNSATAQAGGRALVPMNLHVEPQGGARFTESDTLTIQWHRNNSPIGTPLSIPIVSGWVPASLVVNDVAPNQAGTYTLRVSLGDRVIDTSPEVRLNVTPRRG